MALQPASGARDLNPQQVEHNKALRERLAEVYRCWGYEEVSPPQVERMETLKAGGGLTAQTSCAWWPMNPWDCAQN